MRKAICAANCYNDLYRLAFDGRSGNTHLILSAGMSEVLQGDASSADELESQASLKDLKIGRVVALHAFRNAGRGQI